MTQPTTSAAPVARGCLVNGVDCCWLRLFVVVVDLTESTRRARPFKHAVVSSSCMRMIHGWHVHRLTRACRRSMVMMPTLHMVSMEKGISTLAMARK
jgi:hypothetical protein